MRNNAQVKFDPGSEKNRPVVNHDNEAQVHQ